ncbi:MAG: hypothetical protein RLZZ11_112 [Cyanobacteriota bacterium]|jgi:hypothetical protein
MEMMQPPSAHEAFTLMLLERLERLEDDHRALAGAFETLHRRVPYEWYKITMSARVSAGDDEAYYTSLRKRWINQLFSARAVYKPLFAYWNWFIDGVDRDDGRGSMDVFHIHCYIQFQKPATMNDIAGVFGTMGHTATPVQGGVAEVKMILKERFEYLSMFPEATADYGADIWRRGGDPFEYPLDEKWTDGAFLESPEYCQIFHALHPDRETFLDYIMVGVKNNRWLELFGMAA